MTKVISTARMNVLSSVSTRYGRDKDIRVEIVDNSGFGEEKVKYGVNWSAIGTVDARKAIEFADYITFIANLVDRINKLDIAFEYGKNDPEIHNKGEYVDACKKLYKAFESRDIEAVVNFMNV